MRVFFSSLCSMGYAAVLLANPGDTTTVTVHNAVDMTWYGNYDQQGVFPNDPQKSYHRVWMHYTMGCATGGCSDWDYTTQILLLAPTGVMDSTITQLDTISTMPLQVDTTWNVFEVMQPHELGRVITPYGSSLSNTWTRNFIFDVTDFVHLLRDTVNIRAFYSGWSSGFSATLHFHFVEGTPIREVLGVYNLYQDGATYDNSANFEANYFHTKSLSLPPNTASGRIFSTITGHGFDNNVNCAEFCQRSYAIQVNGQGAGSRNIWRDDCGSNPLYPQGGTWLYDRAGWCPGDKGITHEWEVGVMLQAGTTNTIDFDMQAYSWSGNQAPSYIVDARLVAYGAPHFSNDAALLDVIAPTKDFQYSRRNAFCGNPILKVQNTGANPLTSVTIQYGLQGAADCQYNWTGNLAFLETVEVELPQLSWSGADFANPLFYARITAANGTNDEYLYNNEAYRAFNLPALHNFSTMYIELKTNNQGTETGYQLLDADGNVVWERVAATLTPNTTYLDPIAFPNGCYMLRATDSAKDGLSFWAEPAAGSGSIKLLRQHPTLGMLPVKSFGADFGTFLYYPFIVGADKTAIDDNATSGCLLSHTDEIPTNTTNRIFSAVLSPNPCQGGQAYLQLDMHQCSDVQVQVTDMMGRRIRQITHSNVWSQRIALDLSDAAAGLYLIHVQAGGQQWQQSLSVMR